MLSKGDRAPDFEAISDTGEKVRLSDYLKRGPVVLYFYPKDETPGCTAEACSFRDKWDEINSLGATVMGVSGDSPESHRKFKERHRLNFMLLSDPDGYIRKLYDAKGFLIPPRVTYVISQDGTIYHVFNSQMQASRHSAEAMEALKRMLSTTR